MKLLLMIVTALIPGLAVCQDHWVVSYQGKNLLEARAENATDNVIRLKQSDLLKNASFQVVYTEDPSKPDWQRSIIAVGTKDKELNKQSGSKFTLSGKKLLTLFKTHKKIYIYTWALPKDPELRSRVRVRRVLLCTIICS